MQLQSTEEEEKSATEQPYPLREREVSLKKRHWSYLLLITRSLEVEGEEEKTASVSLWTEGLEAIRGIERRIGEDKSDKGASVLFTK